MKKEDYPGLGYENANASYRKTEYTSNNGLMDWTSSNLPPAIEYWISDIDSGFFVFRNNKNIFQFCEIKCYMGKVTGHQKNTFNAIHYFMRKGIEATNGEFPENGKVHHYRYDGFHLLQFENTCPSDGKIYWDNVEITESELIEKLSFE